RRQVAEFAAERDYARSALEIHPCHLVRPDPADVDAAGQQSLHDLRRQLIVGLSPGGHRVRHDTALGGEAAAMFRGDDTLRRSMQAHEQHSWTGLAMAGSYFTKTQSGLRRGKAMRPTIAAAAMSSGLLTFQRNNTTRLTSATSAVSQSPIAIFPSRTHAPRM